MSKSIKISFWWVIFITLMVQFGLISYTFPLSELLSEQILSSTDNPAHWYRITAAVTLSESYNFTGFDPYFAGGSKVGIAGNPGAKIPTLMAIIFASFLTAAQSWKLYTFIATLIAPLCIPFAMRIFQLPNLSIAMGGVFAIIIWWTSMFHWFHTAGLVSFVLASYLSILFLALIYRLIVNGFSFYHAIGIGIFGAIGTLIHPLFPLPIVFGTLVILLLHRDKVNYKKLSQLILVIPVISIIPNLTWVIPIFFAPKIYFTGQINATHQIIVDLSLIYKEMLGIWQGDSHGSKVYTLLVLTTVFALFSEKSKRERDILIIVISSAIFWTFYAFSASAFGTLATYTQPNRFAPVAYLFLCIAGAIGTAKLISVVGKTNFQTKVFPKKSLAFFTIVFLLFALNFNEVKREVSYSNVGHYGKTPPQVEPLGKYSQYIINWINNNTNTDNRILFEVSSGKVHDGGHLAGYYAYTTNREFIGGPYPFSHFAGFWDGTIFSRPIEEIPQKKFDNYLSLYNVGWAIAFSDQSKAYFEKSDSFTQVDEFEELRFYKITTENKGFFIEGKGKVLERGHNKLILSNLDGSTVTVKYHYLKGMKTRPPVEITPKSYMDDPNPFISLINAPSKVEIYLP